MVAGSSLRRPPKSRSTHPPEQVQTQVQTQAQDPPTNSTSSNLNSNTTSTSDHSSLPLRSKRIRATTLSDPNQNTKRRKVIAHRPQPLRIPLRGRSLQLVPQSPSHPQSPPQTPPKASSIDLPTPTGKPQYDQIRIIEEKARKAIQQRHDADASTSTQPDQRKLRKHGGTRSNTELAQYFPNFLDMLSLDPPDPDALTIKTQIVLVNDTPDYEPPLPRHDPFGSTKPLHNTAILDLPTSKLLKKPSVQDPMSEEVYLKIHRKNERHEKQMKNGDREKAQHEKYQLERLLEELRGPDWLKTLGISGITDTEKKRYEPKRILFIRETQAMIKKFLWWKEEEKRRKLEQEQELRAEAAEAEEREEEESVSNSNKTSSSRRSMSTQPPNSSEIDALASQQLLEEAKSASKRKKTIAPEPPPPPPPPVYKPFTSFFEKRHLRDAAVSGRQRGRTLLAFGFPIPDMEEVEFALPQSILTPDAIRANERSSRRRRRDVDDD